MYDTGVYNVRTTLNNNWNYKIIVQIYSRGKKKKILSEKNRFYRVRRADEEVLYR